MPARPQLSFPSSVSSMSISFYVIVMAMTAAAADFIDVNGYVAVIQAFGREDTRIPIVVISGTAIN